MDILNKQEINKILENNLKTKVTYLPSLCPEMETNVTDSNITYVDSGFTPDTFNVVCGGDFTSSYIHQDIVKLIKHYTDHNKKMAWWLGPTTWSNEIDKLLTSHGLVHTETETAMAANCKDIVLPEFKDNKQLEVQEVIKMKQFEDYSHVLASIFEPYDYEAIDFYKQVANYYRPGKVIMYVAYLANIPVAISSLVIEEDFGAIYDVATHPKYQRQGLGKHMTLVAIQTLKEKGCSVIGMQASEEGKSIYSRLGFNSYGIFRIYSNYKLLQ